jgi:MFS family permease
MNRSILLRDVDEHTGTNYAEPLAGLRVSWGSILAGTLGLIATSTILWALAAAITLTATNATVSSLTGTLIALWICAMVTTLVGALVGGWIAGYMPGNGNRFLGGIHGFLAWALAFIVVSTAGFGVAGSITRTATNAAVSTASATVQMAGSAVGGAAGGQMKLDTAAVNLLESLGYPPREANSSIATAKADIQRVLRRGVSTGGATGTVRSLANGLVDWTAGLTWSWFGTWFLAGILSVAGGIAASRQVYRRVPPERAVREEEAVPMVPPQVRPQPA